MFYTPNAETSPFLPEEESQHAIKSLRLQAGSRVELVDGNGGFYVAEIVSPHPKRCEVRILEKRLELHKRNGYIHIAIAPTKNIERLEWFVEKATEIGIDEITPVICRFSERKIVKRERLVKIAVSAMKQSLKAYLPKINEQCSFDELIYCSENLTQCQRFIAHCQDGYCHDKQEKKRLSSLSLSHLEALVMIGPEGDFSLDEVVQAVKAGFTPVSLGESRLRTETAGIVACHTMNLLYPAKNGQ